MSRLNAGRSGASSACSWRTGRRASVRAVGNEAQRLWRRSRRRGTKPGAPAAFPRGYGLVPRTSGMLPGASEVRGRCPTGRALRPRARASFRSGWGSMPGRRACGGCVRQRGRRTWAARPAGWRSKGGHVGWVPARLAGGGFDLGGRPGWAPSKEGRLGFEGWPARERRRAPSWATEARGSRRTPLGNRGIRSGDRRSMRGEERGAARGSRPGLQCRDAAPQR